MALYIHYPSPPTGGGGVTVYANSAAFPPTAADGTLAVAADTHILYEYNATAVAWQPIASNIAYMLALASAGAATSIGALDSQPENAEGLALVGGVLSAQSADATHPGLVNNTGQIFSGAKTFSSTILANGGVDLSAPGTLALGTSPNATTINIGNSGATVNIQGTTIYENTPLLQVADPLITVNHGGAAGSASNSGIEIEENSIITGYAETSGDRNSWTFKAPNTAGIAVVTPGASGITLNQSSHDPVTLTAVGGTPNANAASLASQVLTLQPANTSFPGVLLAADWNTFNNKQAAGNYITALTGDVTAAGPGSVAATVAKIQGTTVSGTTGSTNVVFSASPTITGTLTATTITASGNVTGLNLSGTNTGDVTLASVGAVPSANAASLSGQVLTLQPADLTHPGVVTSGSQTFGGAKSFNVSATSPIFSTSSGNPALTGILRLANTEGVTWRNGANSADLSIALSALDTFLIAAPISVTGAIAATTTVSGLNGAFTTTTSTAFKSSSANVAANGVIRLANSVDVINWRNAANSANLGIFVDSGNIFQIGTATTVSGNLLATNLSGTNTGDVALATVGSSPNTSGASLASQTLTLQPADATNPGVITAGTQTIGGAKTFSGGVTATVTGTASGNTTITPTSHGVVISGAANAMTATSAGAVGQVLTSNGASADPTFQTPAASVYAPPTQQTLTTPGSNTYIKNYTFNITSGSATLNATYTNNGSTFTVSRTVASALQVVMRASGAPTSSGTLTKTSGTGDSTITFSSVSAPIALRVRMVGGGGSGGGAGSGSSAGNTGTATTFDTLTAGGGLGGSPVGYGGAGGSSSLGAGGWMGLAVSGGSGGPGGQASILLVGGNGGYSALGGGGSGGMPTGASGSPGLTGVNNTGGGGGGGASGTGASVSGSGGGSGGYVDAVLSGVQLTGVNTFNYVVGAGNAGPGSGGTGGSGGGVGGDGVIIVEEIYQ